MAVISGVSIDRVGDLFDLPLGENGDIARLANGGYAVIAEVAGLGFSILRVFDAEGNAVRSLAFEGSAPAIAGLSDGRIAVTTQVDGFMTPIIVRADFRSFETLSSVSLNSGAVSAGANGTFVSANTEQFATDRDVDLTFYDSAGTVLTRVDIESDANIEARDVDVAVLTNGNAVVTRTHTDLSTGAVASSFLCMIPWATWLSPIPKSRTPPCLEISGMPESSPPQTASLSFMNTACSGH